MPVIRGQPKGEGEGIALGALQRPRAFVGYQQQFPSTAESYGTAATALARFANQLLDLRQQVNFYRIEKGQLAGKTNAGTTIEGKTGLITLPPDDKAGVQGDPEAYAIASHEAYIAKTRRNIQETYARFGDQFKNDPASFQRAAEAYGSELMGSVPPSARDAVAEEIDHYHSKTQTYISANTLAELDAAQQASTDEEFIAKKSRFFSALVNNDQAEQDKMLKVDFPEFYKRATGSNGGRPGWSQAKLIAEMGTFKRDITTWSYYGKYQNGTLNVADFFAHPPPEMDPKDWMALRGTINAEMSRKRAEANRGKAQARADVKEKRGKNLVAVMANIAMFKTGVEGARKYDEMSINELAKDGTLTSAGAIQAINALHSDISVDDTPAAYAHVNEMINQGEYVGAKDFLANNAGLLKPSTQETLYGRIDSALDKDNPIAVNRAWLEKALTGGTPLTLLTGSMQATAIMALQKYDQTLRGEPLTPPPPEPGKPQAPPSRVAEVTALELYGEYATALGSVTGTPLPGIALPGRYTPRAVNPADPYAKTAEELALQADWDARKISAEDYGNWLMLQRPLISGLQRHAIMGGK